MGKSICQICDQPAFYNYKDKKPGIMCKEHKNKDMVDVRKIICLIPTCHTQAYFNFPGENVKKYCFKHKEDGMINIAAKKCKEKDCSVSAYFNFPGEKPILCDSHKEAGMINVVDKRCKEKDCSKFPVYNFPGERPLFCFTHKEKEMVNVKNSTCLEPGCYAMPRFAFVPDIVEVSDAVEDGEVSEAVETCKSEEVEYNKEVDETNIIEKELSKLVIKENEEVEEINKILPNPDIKKEKTKKIKPLYCGTHKKPGMENVKDHKCYHEGCKLIPKFNFEGQKKGIYCSSHKKEDMIDVNHTKCLSSWCYSSVSKKYDGYCCYCFVHLFPEHELSKPFKIKESYMLEAIKNKFPDLCWIFDKKISGGCSSRRPDVLLNLPLFSLVIECDETQHSRHETTCENKRTMQLFIDLGSKPLVLIRFNPDYYKIGNKKIESCFRANSQTYRLYLHSKTDWEKRKLKLFETIQKYLDLKDFPEKEITTEYLFYNQD